MDEFEIDREALLADLRRALAGPITSMTGVGLTSRWVAANRALETEHAQPLYRDPLARDLAGEALRPAVRFADHYQQREGG